MVHSIITILTTTAVALHAMLGCCAHHTHAGDSHESGLAVVASVEVDDHCSHGHHHHDDDSDSQGENLDNSCGHEHDGSGRHECDGGDCSFASLQRSNDLELMLTFSIWCQPIDSDAVASSLEGLLSLRSASESPSDPLMDSGSARAISQVWRL